MMSNFENKFGKYYKAIKGYVVEAQKDMYKHKFGGQLWLVNDEKSLGNGPALLFTLDLTDPKLSLFSAFSLDELPLVSYINSDIWCEEQIYKLDNNSKTVKLIHKTEQVKTTYHDVDLLPQPLPEISVCLRQMQQNEYPLDEQLYWQNIDDFLGGKSPFRVAGNPLWVQEVETVSCCCGKQMTFILGVGYECLEAESKFIENHAFFIGEGVLYFFFCNNCLILKVISQPT